MFTASEKKIIKKIRTYTKDSLKTYSFWFIYGPDDKAITWEGGYDLPNGVSFRNDFSLAPGDYQRIQKRRVKC